MKLEFALRLRAVFVLLALALALGADGCEVSRRPQPKSPLTFPFADELRAVGVVIGKPAPERVYFISDGAGLEAFHAWTETVKRTDPLDLSLAALGRSGSIDLCLEGGRIVRFSWASDDLLETREHWGYAADMVALAELLAESRAQQCERYAWCDEDDTFRWVWPMDQAPDDGIGSR